MLKKNLLRALLTLSLSTSAFAVGDVGDFNFNETTGLINIPAARVAPPRSLKISAQAAAINRAGNGSGTTGGRLFKDFDDGLFSNDGSFRGIFGLGGNVEISILALHGSANPKEWVFGAKWLAIEDSEDHPAFAIGVQSLNNKARPITTNPHPASFDKPDFFGVVGHTFNLNEDGLALELHGGLGTGRLKNGFLGAELHINDTVSLIGEYDGTMESAGLRITPHPRWEIMPVLQYQNGSISQRDPNLLFFGRNQVYLGLNISYLIGGGEQPPRKPTPKTPEDTAPHSEGDGGKASDDKKSAPVEHNTAPDPGAREHKAPQSQIQLQPLAVVPPQAVEVKPEPMVAPPQAVEAKPEPMVAPPKAVEVKPEPAAVQPKTVEVKPEPMVAPPKAVEVKPEPAAVQPKTVEVKPAPAQVATAPLVRQVEDSGRSAQGAKSSLTPQIAPLAEHSASAPTEQQDSPSHGQ